MYPLLGLTDQAKDVKKTMKNQDGTPRELLPLVVHVLHFGVQKFEVQIFVHRNEQVSNWLAQPPKAQLP